MRGRRTCPAAASRKPSISLGLRRVVWHSRPRLWDCYSITSSDTCSESFWVSSVPPWWVLLLTLQSRRSRATCPGEALDRGDSSPPLPPFLCVSKVLGFYPLTGSVRPRLSPRSAHLR